jgi:ring-1,2-phenylacetyl-CoA epoxidase subunit PaaC
MSDAIAACWPYVGELFLDDAHDQALAAADVAPLPSSLKAEWEQTVARVFREGTLEMPSSAFTHKGGKRGVHTEHLGFILAEMQFLQRAYPDATW